MPVTVDLFEPAELKDALVVVAFPSTGAAAPIAGSYLHRHMGLPLVGHLQSEALAAVVQIEAGVATSPLRIHGGETQCNLDGPCPRIYLVTSEIPVPDELLPEVAEAVAQWAEGAKMILSLDAVARDAGDEVPDVYTGGSSPETLAALARTGCEPMPKALIGGLTAYLLSTGRSRGLPCATLVVEAARSHPDGRAAAALVEKLDLLLPDLKVDPKPLLEDALALEEEIKHAMDAAEEAQPKRPMHTFI